MGEKGVSGTKRELISIILIASILLVFFSVAIILEHRVEVKLRNLRQQLESEGFRDAKSITNLDSENLSKRWDLYSRSLTLSDVDLRTIVVKSQTGRGRRLIDVSKPKEINFLDFLGIVSLGLLNDAKIVFPALVLSTVFALLLPLFFVWEVRLSSFIPFALSYVPPFLVIVLVFYFRGASKFLTLLAFGFLMSTRLGIQLANAVRSLEKDDYVIYMLLGGNSRKNVTFKYTYFELLDSILWTVLWMFYTLFSFKLAMNSLSLSDHYEVNLGTLLMGIFSELPSKSAMLQFGVLSLTIGLLYLLMYALTSRVVTMFKISVGIASSERRGILTMRKPDVVRGLSLKRLEEPHISPEQFLGIKVKELSVLTKSISASALIVRTVGSFQIELGDKVFVKGPSGSGKTILTNALIGVLWDKKLSYSGEVAYKFYTGHLNIIGDPQARLGLLGSGILEIVPQNPKHGFNPYASVFSQIRDFGLLEDFRELLKNYFPDSFDRIMQSIHLPPSKINDGALQIVNFVLTVARMRNRPGVILFDEPIASLSKKNVLKVYEMLKETLWDGNHIILWIGHELETIKSLSFNKLLSVEETEQGAVATLMPLDSSFVDEYERHVNDVVEKVSTILEKRSALRKEYGEKLRYFIDVKKISFVGRKLVLTPRDKVSVSVGDVVFIKGDNGSGKTTMIKAIIGYLRNEVIGEIVWNDGNEQIIVNKSKVNLLARAYWKEIDVIFQNPDVSVPKYLKIDERILKDGRRLSASSFKELLDAYGLKNCYGKRFHQLSYGQKKRVKLVRMILKNPSVIFLDEATASLDIKNIENFVGMIERIITEKPQTILFIVTHQDIFDQVPSHLTKVIEMEGAVGI